MYIADISHNQASYDAVAYRRAGHDRIRLKATQGTTYVDPSYAQRVAESHAAGLTVDHYSFLTGEPGAAQADHFLATVIPRLGPGDRFMADLEPNPFGSTVTAPVAAEFVDTCHVKAPSVDGLEYSGPYFLRDNHIVSLHGWGLVLADYTTAKSPVFWPPGFDKVPVEWQFTDAAVTAGIPGHSDLSRVVRAKPAPPVPRDLTRWQHHKTVGFTNAMNDRKHPFTPSAIHVVDVAVTAATRAKGIR